MLPIMERIPHLSQMEMALSNDDCIFVFDTESEEITDTISTRIGPNAMEFVNNKLFVLNFGGWSTDSFMTVINTETLAVEKEIELAKRSSRPCY